MSIKVDHKGMYTFLFIDKLFQMSPLFPKIIFVTELSYAP